jgi:hypothetical protein
MVNTLAQLTGASDPAIDLIREWVSSAENQCKILPPSSERESVLIEIQVTTRCSITPR